MKDKLLGAVIGLARATENNEELITEVTDSVLAEGLVATLSDSTCSDSELEEIYNRIMAEKQRIIPSCFTCAFPCGRTDNYNMQELYDMDTELRSLKIQLLTGIQTLANKPNRDSETNAYLYKALILFGIYWDEDGMIPILEKLNKILEKY